MSAKAAGTSSHLISIPGVWDFQYTYFAGETASRFFNALRLERRIYGTLCPKCRRILVPARSFCDACYCVTESWTPVGPAGTLETFTIIGTQFPGLPPPPFIIGYVTLDGSSTAILNYVTGLQVTDIDSAATMLMNRPRVRAVFADQCEGRITDFHFELAQA